MVRKHAYTDGYPYAHNSPIVPFVSRLSMEKET